MIAINILFLIPFKIREAILNYWDQQRIDKLKLISEVEQKYMFFDYKRFFNSTIEQFKYGGSEKSVKEKKKKSTILKPTEIYVPSDDESEVESVVDSIKDEREKTPPSNIYAVNSEAARLNELPI